MIRRPPRSTRTDTLFPYTTLFRFTTISNFYGKRFNSPEHCEPMLRTDDEGKVYAWGDWGEARLREVGYWGKVQSAVIYDDSALMDYFRKVHDALVIGLGYWTGKPKGFFWLIRGKTPH